MLIWKHDRDSIQHSHMRNRFSERIKLTHNNFHLKAYGLVTPILIPKQGYYGVIRFSKRVLESKISFIRIIGGWV